MVWFNTYVYTTSSPPPPSIHSIFSIVFCILCLLQEVVSALSFLVILCLTQVTGERSEVTHDINERVARYSLFARGVTALLSALRGGGSLGKINMAVALAAVQFCDIVVMWVKTLYDIDKLGILSSQTKYICSE